MPIYFHAVAHKDLAGNVFASMDKDLSADSDDEEENIESYEDQQLPELERNHENSSIGQSDELASNASENVDKASVDEGDVESSADDGNDDADTGSGDGDAESDIEINADDASDISGMMLFACSACLIVFYTAVTSSQWRTRPDGAPCHYCLCYRPSGCPGPPTDHELQPG